MVGRTTQRPAFGSLGSYDTSDDVRTNATVRLPCTRLGYPDDFPQFPQTILLQYLQTWYSRLV